jgi:hypothetical protein
MNNPTTLFVFVRMRHVTPSVLCMLVALAIVNGQTTRADTPARLRVALVPVMPPFMSERELRVTKREAARVWAESGVDLVWLEGKVQCERPPVPDACLHVIFQKRLRATTEWIANPPLGQVDFSPDGRPFPEIRLGYDDVADILAHWDHRFGPGGPTIVRQEVTGRALGRVVAHEIGHILLASPTHSDEGLMRRTFHPRELASLSAAWFELSPADVVKVQARAGSRDSAAALSARRDLPEEQPGVREMLGSIGRPLTNEEVMRNDSSARP